MEIFYLLCILLPYAGILYINWEDEKKFVWNTCYTYFTRSIHIRCFLHSCTLAFTLRALFRCHSSYLYLIWLFLEYFAIAFYSELVVVLYCYDILFVRVGWFIIWYFLVLSSPHSQVCWLVESHASNLMLRGWNLFRGIFSEDKGALP